MNLQELQRTVYEINEAHGWHDDALCEVRGTYNEHGQLTLPTGLNHTAILAKLALVHTELGEADDELNEHRFALWMDDGKPEGWVVELADAVIRIADTCEVLGLGLNGPAQPVAGQFNLRRTVDHASEAIRVDDVPGFHELCKYFIHGVSTECVQEDLLAEALQAKITYNRTRSFKHGGKRA